jgi:formate dehydrogenase maturation protein FdhE
MEETTGVEFEVMKEFFAPQVACPDGCEPPADLQVQGTESGVRHMRCRCCDCEWFELLS